MSDRPNRRLRNKETSRAGLGSVAHISLGSLAEAQSYSDGVVRLSGDYGSITYLTCPSRLVRCTSEQLDTLLIDLDSLIFPSSSDAKITYERWVLCVGTVFGTPNELQIHTVLEPFDLDHEIRSILWARDDRLPDVEEMLKRAKALQPEKPRWPWRLAFLYKARADTASGPQQTELAAKSLVEFETALRLGNVWSDSWIPNVPEVALMAGEVTKARDYAQWVLRLGWESVARVRYSSRTGEYIHRGNIVLGKVALADGDLQQATAQLIEAGKAPWVISSPNERPDMTLAAILLDRGERGAVIEYLSLCELIWKGHRDELSGMIQAVKTGGGL